MSLEEINNNTYNEISLEFSNSRTYIWQCVKDFCNLINDSNIPNIIEIGCGNGKNLEYIKSIKNSNLIGIDNCQNFVDLCLKKNLNVLNNSAYNINFKDNTFDYMLCIAMFHHLLTPESQINVLNEILRIMKKGSLGIITCWAVEQSNNNITFTEGINIVPWKGKKIINKIRYYYVYNQKMFYEYFEKIKEIQIIKIYNDVGNWVIIFKKL
jgi:ubiquinone/menaquinone biosynthesis C-methylase UbiE